jgi:CheY-like chemotaxis protein
MESAQIYGSMTPAPLKILAVDDDDSIRGSMPFIFPTPQYEVSTAAQAAEALEQLATSADHYDVIITDLRMPEMTGLELVQGIRARGIVGKIVVLSAHVSAEVRKAFEQLNVDIIVSKPFGVQELRHAVDGAAA